MPDRQMAGSSGAQVRGDIQSGDSGDKRPGFDPALAPLETDSEAGGQGLDSERAEMARRTQHSMVNNGPDPSFNSAMRPPERAKRRHVQRWVWPAAIAASVAVALAVFALLTTA